MQLIIMEKFRITSTGIDPYVKTNQDAISARFGHLNAVVDAVTKLQNTPPGSGVESVQAGTDISVDNTDPLNPIVNSTVVYSSGSFTPVFTNETNSPVLLTSVGGQYVRINDIVIMSFRFNVQMNAGFNNTDFNFSLPIASTFTNLYELLGTNSRPSNLNGCSVYADITNNLGTCAVNTTSNGQTVNALSIIAQYQIL